MGHTSQRGNRPGLVAALIMMAAVLLPLAAGCKDGDDRVARAGSASKPSIRIVSPVAQDKITGDTVRVEVEVKDFTLDPAAIGTFAVTGKGHWHIYLDGDWIGTSAVGDFKLEGLSPGPHQIKVALANNDHSPLRPPAEDSVIVEAIGISTGQPDNGGAADGPSPGSGAVPAEMRSPHFVRSSPSHGEEVYGGPVTVEISFDFRLAPESLIQVFRDGQTVAVGPTTIAPDQHAMSAVVAGASVPGVYQVVYQACWPYLNCHEGTFSFIVEPPGSDGHATY